MTRPTYRGKKAPATRYFGDAPFVLVSDELRQSAAYQTLTPTARLVLIDLIGHFARKTRGGKESLAGVGLEYAHAVCREVVSHNAFHAAVRAVVERGFFVCPPELQPLSVARPARYLPSRAWCAWHDADAAARVERRKARGKARRKRDTARRIDRLRHAPGTAESGTKIGGEPGTKKRGDHRADTPRIGTKIRGDTCPI